MTHFSSVVDLEPPHRPAAHFLTDLSERVNCRSIKPRSPKHERSSVVAVTQTEGVFLEQVWNARSRSYLPALETTDSAKRTLTPERIEDGLRVYNHYPFDQFHILFPLLPRNTVILTTDGLGLAKYLESLFSNGWIRSTLAPMHGEFFITLTEMEKDIAFRADRARITARIYRVTSLGFRNSQKKAHHSFVLVNAPDFFSNSALRDRKWTLSDLLQVGQFLASECSLIGVRMGSSPGMVAAQMLRLDTFYRAPRRRIPSATNERARLAANGHCYDLKVSPNKVVDFALQFDQARSHATVAAQIDLPTSNLLCARGSFHKPDDDTRKYQPHSSQFKKLLKFYGLFDVILYNLHPEFPWIPPQYRHDSDFRTYITSNEIEWLANNNIQVRSIIGCWASPVCDEGIRHYARDGLRRIDEREGLEREAIKTIVNSGIGVLGSKPRRRKLIRNLAIHGGEPISIRTANGILKLQRKEFTRYQLSIANMVQRVMIERECAKRSYELAALLDSHNWQIVNVYADSVFATPPPGQQSMYTLPDHWNLEREHTNIQFRSATTWISDQGEKLPGVSLAARSRARGRWSDQPT